MKAHLDKIRNSKDPADKQEADAIEQLLEYFTPGGNGGDCWPIKDTILPDSVDPMTPKMLISIVDDFKMEDMLNTPEIVKKRGKKLSRDEVFQYVVDSIMAERKRLRIDDEGTYKSDAYIERCLMTNVPNKDAPDMSERGAHMDAVASSDVDENPKLVEDGKPVTGTGTPDPNAAASEGRPAVQFGSTPVVGDIGHVNGSAQWNQSASQFQMLYAQRLIETPQYEQIMVVSTILDIMQRDARTYTSSIGSHLMNRPGATRADRKIAKRIMAADRESARAVADLKVAYRAMSLSVAGAAARAAAENGANIPEDVMQRLTNGSGNSPLSVMARKAESRAADSDAPEVNAKGKPESEARGGPVDADTFTGKVPGMSGGAADGLREKIRKAMGKNKDSRPLPKEAAEEFAGTVSEKPDKSKPPLHKRLFNFVSASASSAWSKVKAIPGKIAGHKKEKPAKDLGAEADGHGGIDDDDEDYDALMEAALEYDIDDEEEPFGPGADDEEEESPEPGADGEEEESPEPGADGEEEESPEPGVDGEEPSEPGSDGESHETPGGGTGRGDGGGTSEKPPRATEEDIAAAAKKFMDELEESQKAVAKACADVDEATKKLYAGNEQARKLIDEQMRKAAGGSGLSDKDRELLEGLAPGAVVSAEDLVAAAAASSPLPVYTGDSPVMAKFRQEEKESAAKQQAGSVESEEQEEENDLHNGLG